MSSTIYIISWHVEMLLCLIELTFYHTYTVTIGVKTDYILVLVNKEKLDKIVFILRTFLITWRKILSDLKFIIVSSTYTLLLTNPNNEKLKQR